MGRKHRASAVETLSLLKRRLSPKCAVRLSPFCEQIIAMRLKRVPFREIEQWLMKQGADYRISYATISRNLSVAGFNVDLSFGETKIEEWGGDVELDLSRELAALILAQKHRVDQLVDGENAQNQIRPKGKVVPYYIDRRLAREMELFKAMIADHHRMERENKLSQKGISDKKLVAIVVSADAEQVLTDMLLAGEIELRPEGANPDRSKYH